MNIEEELERLVKRRKIGSCKLCGGQMVPDSVGRYTCRACGEVVLDEVGRVRDYLEKNGATSYTMLEENTKVSAEVLHKFLH
jgi:predicted RNA-binding Zn-ribbon protein involved in translation (DUF1610 family)